MIIVLNKIYYKYDKHRKYYIAYIYNNFNNY